MIQYSWSEAFGKKIKKSFFSKSEVDNILLNIKQLEKEKDRKNYIWKYFEQDKKTLSRIEYFVNHSLFLNELANSDKILNEVNALMGEKSVLFKDKINFKYPNGDGFKPHQDISAGWNKYSSRHITFALPLSDTTLENSCMFFGETQNKQLTETFQDLDENISLKPMPTEKGDVIFFDSYVPHASYKNNTSEARVVLFFTYTPISDGNNYEIYHADKFKKVPPDICKIKGKKYKSGNSNSEEKQF